MSLENPALHEFALGPGHDPVGKSHLRPEKIQRWMGGQHPGTYFQRVITRNRLDEPNVKIPRDRLNSTMKQAVRHRLIQQGGNNTSVKHVVISLEFSVRFESCLDDALSCSLERQIQRPRVQDSAQQTPAVTMVGAESL